MRTCVCVSSTYARVTERNIAGERIREKKNKNVTVVRRKLTRWNTSDAAQSEKWQKKKSNVVNTQNFRYTYQCWFDTCQECQHCRRYVCRTVGHTLCITVLTP